MALTDRHCRGVSGYPLVKVVTVMALRSHLLSAACFGLYETDERQYAKALYSSIPANSLVWMDRAYMDAAVFHPPRTLLTSLVDAKPYPAAELRTLYHERWEIELGFGELKTDMLQRLEAIRSRSPETVNQELWGRRDAALRELTGISR